MVQNLVWRRSTTSLDSSRGWSSRRLGNHTPHERRCGGDELVHGDRGDQRTASAPLKTVEIQHLTVETFVFSDPVTNRLEAAN